ncbi:hypothetical protein HK101_010702 [Irineochytrium annulatum]|nr:hypothetical protein HK101_010702 [Irineochytrium annulatum]
MIPDACSPPPRSSKPLAIWDPAASVSHVAQPRGRNLFQTMGAADPAPGQPNRQRLNAEETLFLLERGAVLVRDIATQRRIEAASAEDGLEGYWSVRQGRVT